MEPFGLFQFLQKLMDPSSLKTQSTPPESPDAAEEHAADDPPPRSDDSAQNAILGFLDAHDARAKRIKKP